MNRFISQASEPNWESVVAALGLPYIVHPPKPIMGGLSHRLWRVTTIHGSYAIKQLNPIIMSRPIMYENLLRSEQIARAVRASGLPVLPARLINNSPLTRHEQYTYMVFDWVDGVVLPQANVADRHIAEIGSLLANIHMLDVRVSGHMPFDWFWVSPDYWALLVDRCIEANLETAPVLKRWLPDIQRWTNDYGEAVSRLGERLLLSHRDMDPKNVLWTYSGPVVIDWETAGYINPSLEALTMALAWASDGNGSVNMSLAYGFLAAYREAGGTLDPSANEVATACFGNGLGWLEFSIRRSLGDEDNDLADRNVGLRETHSTLQTLHSLAARQVSVAALYREAATAHSRTYYGQRRAGRMVR